MKKTVDKVDEKKLSSIFSKIDKILIKNKCKKSEVFCISLNYFISVSSELNLGPKFIKALIKEVNEHKKRMADHE